MRRKLTSFVREVDGVYINRHVGYIDYLDGAESDVFSILVNAKSVEYDSDYLASKVINWPLQYHLGKGRASIVMALDLPKDISVLEIGAGCGAITRYLGESFEEVYAIEGNLSRAKIARERCRDLKNVRIIAADVKEVLFDKKFDVVFLIGVLEYAPKYMDLDDKREAVKKLLSIAVSALKERGKVVIAIENKVGIKYWAGCPEDHTGRMFDGIHGYIDRDVVTFSKFEMEEILNEVGLCYKKFFYLFPDYKFANVIISDSLGYESDYYIYSWISFPFPSRGTRRQYLFHEGLALKTLTKANLLREFSNSFLVVASRKDFRINDNLIIKKFSFSRRKEFEVETSLLRDGEGIKVFKRKIFDVGVSGVTMVKHRIVPKCGWIPGETLAWRFHELLLGKEAISKMSNLLNRFLNFVVSKFGIGENDDTGIPMVIGNAVDAIPRNIIVNSNSGDWCLIDLEWEYTKIPVDYVVYRAILNDIWLPNRVYLRCDFRDLIKAIFEEIGLWIDDDRFRKLQDLERNLQKEICGNAITRDF